MVTINDFIVTDLSFATPLQEGSNLMDVADVVMQTYGQPKAATMRDAFGKATLNNRRVNHVELRYEAKNPVTFFVSGAAEVLVLMPASVRVMNVDLVAPHRCARARAKALRTQARQSKAQN